MGGDGTAEGSSTTSEKEREFVDTAVQTPTSQTKQVEEETTKEVSHQGPHQEEGDNGVSREGTHTPAEEDLQEKIT